MRSGRCREPSDTGFAREVASPVPLGATGSAGAEQQLTSLRMHWRSQWHATQLTQLTQLGFAQLFPATHVIPPAERVNLL